MSGKGPQKTCPACAARVPARKGRCACGHVFVSKKRAASPQRPPLAQLPTSTTGRRRSAGSPASYAEPSSKAKLRQKKGVAVPPKAPPPEQRRHKEKPPVAGDVPPQTSAHVPPPEKRRRKEAPPPKKKTPAPAEDAHALLNALEAKDALTVADVRSLATVESDDERVCQLLDGACLQNDAAAPEACAATLVLAAARGGAYIAAERANERAQQLRRCATSGLDVEEGLRACAELIKKRALEDAAVAAACGAAGAIIATAGTTTALLVWRAAFRNYPSHRSSLLEDWLDVARNEGRAKTTRVQLDDDLGGASSWSSVLALVVTQAAVPEGDGVPSMTESDRCCQALAGALLRRSREGPQEPEWRELALTFAADLVAALEAPAWTASAESLVRALARATSTELRKASQDKKSEAYVGFLGDLLSVIVGGVSSVTKRATVSVKPVVEETEGACQMPEENQRLEARVAFQQLQLNGLEVRSATEPLVQEALRFCVAKWHAELPESAKALKRHLAAQMDGRDVARVRRASWDAALPRDKLRGVSAAIVASSPLARGLIQLAKQLVGLLAHQQPKVRDKALRALGRAACDHLLERNVVQQAMRSRFADESPSVRLAAVEVCGDNCQRQPELFVLYEEDLLKRLRDAGLAVRKATARRLKATLTDSRIPPDARARTLSALVRCAARPGEERTVKDLVRDAVREAWFASVQAPRPTQPLPRVSPVTTSEPRPAQVVEPASLDPITRQVVDVVHAAGDDATVEAVFEMALRETDGKRTKQAAQARARAAAHVAHLADHLVRLDASRASEAGRVTPATTPDKQAPDGVGGGALSADAARDVVRTLGAVRAFAKSAPEAVAPALDVISPYLRGDNGLDAPGESCAVRAAAEIIHAACGALPRPASASLASRCAPDLERAALNSRGSAPTAAAVACLAALDATRSNTEAGRSLWRLAALCHDLLRRRRHVGRAALVLGCVAKDWAQGLARGAPDDESEPSTLARMRDPHGAVFACVAHEAAATGAAAARAAQAACASVAGAPRLANAARSDGLLERLLNHPHAAVRAASLRGWADVLDAVDAAARLANADETNAQQVRSAVHGEETIKDDSEGAFQSAAACAQASLKRASRLLEDQDGDVRCASVAFLAAVLRHGLANPRDIAPLLVGRHGDELQKVRDAAGDALRACAAKRPQLVALRFAEGFANACASARRYSDEVPPPILKAVGQSYAVCCEGRASRAKALKSALDVFVTPNDLPAHDGDLAQWLGKRAATARALGSLPFRTADEPLMVVKACARACALDGAALHESLRDAPVSARDAARCGAFALLCRLKAHVKRRHRLGDARCAAYDGDSDRQLGAVRDDAPLVCGPLFSRAALAAVGTARGTSVRASLVADLGHLLAEETADDDLDRPKKPRGRPPKKDPALGARTLSFEAPPPKPKKTKRPRKKRRADDSDDSDGDWGPAGVAAKKRR